ncbi:hypothetical protein SAMN05920897_1153 [Alkalispirochaeta americana]|uniref:Uncharacterized protein n=1 Tax=Alkalispirochaeta americana TaxID=159291 RepID=A0A1N6VK89_9SPIO|nr:hypothetical protein [Alkalispirochaeta americana]SIQ78302.1 hypothetical protein SAMN05920897_1153 [Alkalispirochaeta americana]
MGLVDRLASHDDDHPSSLTRALAMRGGEVFSDQGISDTSSHISDTGSGEIDPGMAVRALLKELHLQQDFGITTPSHLFSLLHRHLHIASGAILIPEQSRQAFSPMATAGLGKTTRFRLRIPTPVFRQLCSRDGAVLLEGSGRETLRPYFSTSDIQRFHRIALLPFLYNREIMAALVICESPLLQLDQEVLDILLAAVTERAGYLLFDGRHRPLAASQGISVLDREHLPVLMDRLRQEASKGDSKEDRQASLTALRVSLEPLVERIHQGSPHLDEQYLSRDLLDTCAVLCADLFSLFRDGKDSFILAGHKHPLVDLDLLVHSIGNTLQQLFKVSMKTPLPYTLLDPAELRAL